jgi:hypothetical protein
VASFQRFGYPSNVTLLKATDRVKRPSILRRLFKRGNGNHPQSSEPASSVNSSAPNIIRDDDTTKVIPKHSKPTRTKQAVGDTSKPKTTTNTISSSYTNTAAMPFLAAGAGFTDTTDDYCPTVPTDNCDGGGQVPLSMLDGHHDAGGASSTAYTSNDTSGGAGTTAVGYSMGDTGGASLVGSGGGYSGDSGGAAAGYGGGG